MLNCHNLIIRSGAFQLCIFSLLHLNNVNNTRGTKGLDTPAQLITSFAQLSCRPLGFTQINKKASSKNVFKLLLKGVVLLK